MDFDKLIERAASDLAAVESTRSNYIAEQTTILSGVPADASLSDDAQARFDTLSTLKREAGDKIATLTEKVANLRAEKAQDDLLTRSAEVSTASVERHAPASIGSEPHTYNPESAREVSFFSDMYRAQTSGDTQAKARQERHMREVQVDQKRATSTSSFAGLVPPIYLVDQAALLARAGRPTANIVRKLPLPETGMNIIIPRGTTGATEAIQATENSAVSLTDEVWANVTIPVATIAGQQTISRQALERGAPGIDQLVYADLAGAYAVALDAQVLSGSGSSGQMLGILNTSGIAQASAFSAAATTTTFMSKLAGAINSVQTSRFAAPDVIIMHPRRFNWLSSQVDSQGRPLVVPNLNGPVNALASFDSPVDLLTNAPAGYILGLPVVLDASIPTSVGTGPEDQVIVARRADLLLWEIGDGAPVDLRFEQTLGNQLTTTLVAYGYAAFTAGRYASAVAVVGGNASTAGYGLVAPSF